MRLGRDDFKVRRWPLIVRSHQSTTRERCPPPPAPLPFYDWCRCIFRVSPARFPVSFFFFTTSADRFRRYDVAYCLMDSGHIRPNRHGNELRLRLPIALPVLDPFSSNQQCQRVSFLVFLFVPLPNVFFLASFYNAETFLIRCDEKKNSFRSCHGAFLLEPMNSSHRHIDASSMPPPKSVRWISLPFASILFLFVCFVCFFFAVLYSFKFWGL